MTRATELPTLLVVASEDEADAAMVCSELKAANVACEAVILKSARDLVDTISEPHTSLVLLVTPLSSIETLDAVRLVYATRPSMPLVVVGPGPHHVVAELMEAGARDGIGWDALARLVPVVKRELGRPAPTSLPVDATRKMLDALPVMLIGVRQGAVVYVNDLARRVVRCGAAPTSLLIEADQPRLAATLAEAAQGHVAVCEALRTDGQHVELTAQRFDGATLVILMREVAVRASGPVGPRRVTQEHPALAVAR